jgi:hypothetical protein
MVAALDLVGVHVAGDALVRVPQQPRDARERLAHLDQQAFERVAKLRIYT